MRIKSSRFWFFLAVGVVLVVGMSLWQSRKQRTVSEKNQFDKAVREISDRDRVGIRLNDQRLVVEVVKSVESISQGLSGRTEIGSDGMLFVFDQAIRPQFWMKEMEFDLDLVWLREGKIVAITAQVPAPSPGTSLADLPHYSTGQVVDMVLEIEAGRAGDWQLEVGDEITAWTDVE